MNSIEISARLISGPELAATLMAYFFPFFRVD
jgi:hypothetical protein